MIIGQLYQYHWHKSNYVKLNFSQIGLINECPKVRMNTSDMILALFNIGVSKIIDESTLIWII